MAITSRFCSRKPWRRWRSSVKESTSTQPSGAVDTRCAILEALGPRGRLIALDRDAIRRSGGTHLDRSAFSLSSRVVFASAATCSSEERVDGIDGALLDLGIASPQIDDPARGFSFRARRTARHAHGSRRAANSAAQWLASASEAELKGVIADYGEERFAQQIARAIVAARAHEPITRTRQLAAIVAKALGARARGDRSQDPATRTFQAIRIHVNQELQELPLALDAVLPCLLPGGRLAVISFHSLEDRLVKQFFRRHSVPFAGDSRLARLAIRDDALPQPPLKLVGRAIRAGEAEVAANPRARSATLRVAERTRSRAARDTRINLLLLAVLVACALSLVTSRHQARKLFVDLEREQAQSRAYEVEFGQLQIEQSTWAMPARVEKIGREQLHMQLPSTARTEILKRDGR